MKLKFLREKLPWHRVEKILRVIEVCAVVLAGCAIFYLPFQIRDLQNNQQNRNFEKLLQLNEIVRQTADDDIYNALDKNEPILKNNGGISTESDLVNYLDDLSTISDAYYKGLISIKDIDDWFYYYFVPAYQSKEVQQYITETRKDCSDCWTDFDDVSRQLIKMDIKK